MIYCCLLQGDSFAIFHALFTVFCSVLAYICIFFPYITCLDEDIQKIAEGGTLNWRDSSLFPGAPHLEFSLNQSLRALFEKKVLKWLMSLLNRVGVWRRILSES